MPLRRRPGFTLIELMIVVAIIGILAAIAIPKFADLIRKSSEGASKGNLGSLRSALSIYYGDMEGQYPTDLASLTVAGKYLSAIPLANAPNYHVSNSIATGWHGGCSPNFPNNEDFDNRGWAYCATPGDAANGTLLIYCTHTDTRGTTWTAY
jgi:prepilin-type N-terminal cleavage/methylation domain-containing protein